MKILRPPFSLWAHCRERQNDIYSAQSILIIKLNTHTVTDNDHKLMSWDFFVCLLLCLSLGSLLVFIWADQKNESLTQKTMHSHWILLGINISALYFFFHGPLLRQNQKDKNGKTTMSINYISSSTIVFHEMGNLSKSRPTT